MSSDNVAVQEDKFFGSMKKENNIKLFDALQNTGNSYPFVASLASKLNDEEKLALTKEIFQEDDIAELIPKLMKNYGFKTYAFYYRHVWGHEIEPSSIICIVASDINKANLKFIEYYLEGKFDDILEDLISPHLDDHEQNDDYPNDQCICKNLSSVDESNAADVVRNIFSVISFTFGE